MTDKKFKLSIPPEVSSSALVEASSVKWFMSPDKLDVSLSDIQPVANFEASGDPYWDDEDYRCVRPYNVVRATDGTGVLVLSIRGSLRADFPYQFGTWMTGYEYIIAAVRRGAADTTIKSIVLDINSPGGMVRGCAECGLEIAAAAKIKPVIAYAADCAASAAYWIASQASEIHVSSTGEVGSIGVITSHWDESKWLDSMGVKVTPIFAGERKNDGSSYLPLSDEAKAGIQKRINAVYAEFIGAVARGRGMNGDDIRNTQAAMFASREAVRNGLADKVSTRAEVMTAAFGAKAVAQTGSDENDNEGSQMTLKPNTPAAQEQPTNPAATGAPVEVQSAAPAPAAADTDKAIADAMARVKSILNCEEAKGREAQANAFAFDTNLDLATVKTLLAAAAVAAPATAEKQGQGFMDQMSNTTNPNIDAGAPQNDNPNDDGLLAMALASMKPRSK